MSVALQKGLPARVRSIERLPAMPAVLKPLLELLREPSDRVSVRKVVDMVSYDKSIVAQCLRIANSALFGRAKTTESIQDAVMSLGIERVKEITLSLSLNQMVPRSKWATDPHVFWRHSLGCALVCKEFAERIAFADSDRAYLGGLLHDLGIIVNSLLFPEEFRAVFEEAASKNAPLEATEQAKLGFTHCETGLLLAEQWKLPKDIVEAIAFHHEEKTLAARQPLVSLVRLGDLLCRMRNLGHGYIEWQSVDFAGDKAWEVLAKNCPRLTGVDLVRLTLDLDSYMEKVTRLVDTILGGAAQGGNGERLPA